MVDDAANATGGLLDGLNCSQREAVVHAGCPLIVLAGPGTGKTRVIVHRIAHLINDRGVEPEKILVSTFTVKAARELRERITELVGVSNAERINAHTLHGFGLRLLQRFGDAIDLPPIVGGLMGGAAAGESEENPAAARRSVLIDSAQSRRLLRGLILRHNLFGPDRAGGVDAIALLAQRHFEYFDNHALTPRDTENMAAKWSAAVARGEGLSGESLDAEQLDAESARQARFASMAALHGEYVIQRRRRGLITFGDLLMLPIEMLRTKADIASIVRDELRHVIVDEFQDVNQANIELLRFLASPDHCRGEERSGGQELVVVGDDDQAIYGFRGSDDRAFWRFESIWTESRRIALTENYRSRPRIIELGNSVIAKADERFEPEKAIEFPRDANAEPPGVVECVNLENDKADGEVIAAMLRVDRAARLQEAIATGTVEEEPWRKYAVIVRGGGDAERVREALWLEGIPAVFDRSVSAADDEGVKSVLAWARLVVRPREVWSAYQLLARPPLGVPIDTISMWDRQYRAAVSRWRTADDGGLEGGPDDPGGFPMWLKRRDGDDQIVAKFVRWHEEFTRAAVEQSAASVLLKIVRETGIIHADLVKESERAKRIEAVVALLRFASERQGRLPPPGGLREFLEYYDDLSDDDRKLNRGEDADKIDDAAGTGRQDEDRRNAVRLLTAHGSKGLEFDTVFVPRVSPQHGYGQVREGGEIEIPPELLARVGSGLAGKDRLRAEERRVFYVACTRARTRLVLLAKRNKKRSAGVNFFEEIVYDDAPAMNTPAQQHAQADVLRRASLVAGRTGGTALGVDPGVREMKDDERRRELISQARTEVRLAAAGALARVDLPGAGAAEFAEAMNELNTAARRLGAIAAIEQGTTIPPFADEGDAFVSGLRTAAEVATSGKVGSISTKTALRAPRSPLSLSYSSIDEYLRCPRCWYVKHQLGFGGETMRPQLHGLALHKAMEKFYLAHRAADADGLPLPSLAALEMMAKAQFRAAANESHAIDAADLDRLLHQVRTMYAKLHDPSVQVLEVEKTIRFKYHEDESGVGHNFEAKIDRIDQITLADGRAGYRIVDYKSGEAWKSLTEPKPDDLQMVIYAIALRAHFGEDVDGVAEYWLGATGQRGQLWFEKMRFDKVRGKIGEAISGILAGEFVRGDKCWGVCDILGP